MNIQWEACKSALEAAYVERPEWYKELKGIIEDWYKQNLIDLPVGNTKPVDHEINRRAKEKILIEAHAENGIVAVVRNGMDCDCTQYRRVSHVSVPSNIFAFVRAEDAHRDSLDGTETMYYGRPSEYPVEHKSADRALEAFENGHPSHVMWGDL